MSWLKQLFNRRRRYDELSESIREHLDEKIADLVDRGMTRKDAERTARREFGNVTRIEERSREVWQWPTLESIWADIKFALRQLRRSPGFTIVCLLTLALGIGTNSAVYSVIQAVLLRPLPYHYPSQLMILADKQDPQDGGILYKDYEAWEQQNHSFTGIAAYFRDSGWSQVTVTAGQLPQSVQGGFVTANFFPVLGVAPLLGRTFTPSETDHQDRVVVLSYSVWRNRFGGSPDVIGQTLRIDGVLSQVIGVMPDTFQFPSSDVKFWAPITTNRYWGDPALNSDNGTNSRGFYARWQAIGRLKEGSTLDEAQADIDAIASHQQVADPDPHRGAGVTVLPLHIQISGNTRLALYILFASVCLLLLIACANVANLVLARNALRTTEIAVRTALGARRGRIAQQLLIESAVLAMLAGVISVAFASLAIHILTSMGPQDIPRLHEAGLNLGVLSFTLAIALLAATFFGLAPIMTMWCGNSSERLITTSRSASASAHLTNTRSLLIVVEFAVSVVLLTAAGLLIHSFLLVHAVNPGFEPTHVLDVNVTFPSGTTGQQRSTDFQAIVDRIRAAPGVRDVGAIDSLFDFGPANKLGLRSIEGRPPEPQTQWTALSWDTVGGDYFQAMGAELLHGRYFSSEDGPTSPLVAIIDESMVRRYWKGENPIGQHFKGQDRRGPGDNWVTVIGVVRDMRTHGLEHKATPHVYEWYRQADDATPDIVVRTANDPDTFAPELRKVVRGTAPEAIISDVTTVQEELLHQLAPMRFQALLLTLFSLLALVLTTVGIYGLIHYSVVQRTHEIGIRMALGAQRAYIVRIIVARGVLLGSAGLGIGLVIDWASTRLLSGLLYGVAPLDPATLTAVSLLLITVALLASLLPALRAATVDPAHALRTE